MSKFRQRIQRIAILVVASVLACTTISHRADAQSSATAPPASPVWVFESTPGGVQVYVDDEFLGTTSPEGRLKISTIKPGKHTLRLLLSGYPDLQMPITLAPGLTETKIEMHKVTTTEPNAAASATPPTPQAPAQSAQAAQTEPLQPPAFATVSGTAHMADGSLAIGGANRLGTVFAIPSENFGKLNECVSRMDVFNCAVLSRTASMNTEYNGSFKFQLANNTYMLIGVETNWSTGSDKTEQAGFVNMQVNGADIHQDITIR